MPSKAHEHAHAVLFHEVMLKIWAMGLSDDVAIDAAADFWNVQRTFRKQGDSTLRPNPPRGIDDPPTLVIEAGVLESLRQLQMDAKNWLIHSSGEVKIVILVSLELARRK